MALKKFVVGCFEDEKVLFPAVAKVRKAGYKFHDIYTPFPVHGLDSAMGLRETSIHTAGFLYGLIGTTTAVTFMTWVFTKDWPVNIGGKPNFALPAWIPITFELTVLFASVGMVLTYCVRNKLFPGYVPRIFDKRTTDDRFALVFDIDGKSDSDVEKIKQLCNSNGAVEVKKRTFDENE
jgi:hypothetical protein